VTARASRSTASRSSALPVLGALSAIPSILSIPSILTILTILAFGVACGKPRAPDAHPIGSVASERAPTRASSPLPRDPRALEGYPPPAGPAQPGCTLQGRWEVEQPREIRLRPEGKAFATFYGTKHAEVRLPEMAAMPEAADAGAAAAKAPRTAFVELDNTSARVWGLVPGDALVLHAGRPILLAGWAAPGPELPLRWLGSTPGKVAVELPLPKHVTAKAPPVGERLCDDLSLGGASFLARDAIPAKSTGAAMLPDGVAIALAERLGGPAIAELIFPAGEDPLVDVLARSGTDARVAIFPSTLDPLADVVLVGWVPASLLRPHTHGFGGSWATGGGASPASGRHRGEHWSCPREVPIVAELDGDRRLVGAVAPKTRIDVPAGGTSSGSADGGAEEDFVEVSLDAAQLMAAPGARLLVKRAALVGCVAPARP
jgi:hypothetical protein